MISSGLCFMRYMLVVRDADVTDIKVDHITGKLCMRTVVKSSFILQNVE